ncbi:MAG: response regulator transcription factor [Micromonosporaceae bacterium]
MRAPAPPAAAQREEPQSYAFWRELGRAVLPVVELAVIDQAADVPIASGRVRVQGTEYLFQAEILRTTQADRVPVVFVERADAAAFSETELRSRFGLTGREAQVAGRLAARRTNREIAAELHISEHTARRHTERVLLKLGVRHRENVYGTIADLRGTPVPHVMHK